MTPYSCIAKIATKVFHAVDAERAHILSIAALKNAPMLPTIDIPKGIEVKVAGLTFPSPFGVAAGYDKNGEIPHKMMQLGFGHVEVGTITPFPQPGNPKPRSFRLTPDRAVINRMGFNGVGAGVAYRNLSSLREQNLIKGILGINVGANKDSPNRVNDYVVGVRTFADVADYLTVNISSPNTSGLRDLQGGAEFIRLLESTIEARDKLKTRPPLFYKFAPDLTDEQIEEICKQLLKHKADGVILTNTTISRPPLKSRFKNETGGLSGAPLKTLSLEVQKKFHAHLKKQIPIIGVGGIETIEDVRERLRHGAKLVQIYSAMVFSGFGLIHDLNQEMAKKLDKK